MERCWNGGDYPMGIWNAGGTVVGHFFPKRRSHELTSKDDQRPHEAFKYKHLISWVVELYTT